MALSGQTFTDIGGASTDLFEGVTSLFAIGSQVAGDLTEQQNYKMAAQLALQNEQYTQQSTATQEAMASREIALNLGTTKASVASAGFEMGGSALDILRSGAQQGALQKQLLQEQGLITEAGYQEQAEAYTNLANYAGEAAGSAVLSGVLGGVGSMVGAGLDIGAAAVTMRL